MKKTNMQFKVVKHLIEENHKAVEIYQVYVYREVREVYSEDVKRKTLLDFLNPFFMDIRSRVRYVKKWTKQKEDSVCIGYHYYVGSDYPYFYTKEDAEKYIEYTLK